MLPVYGLPGEVLESLSYKDDPLTAATIDFESREQNLASNSTISDQSIGSAACSLCKLSFATPSDQRSHTKSDLHHYNLKQRLRGQKPVSEPEFEILIEALDESLSGSDSSESEENDDDASSSGKQESTLTALLKRQAKLADENGSDPDAQGSLSLTKRNKGRPPLIWFGSPLLPDNHFFGIYRAILTGEDLRNTDLVNVVRRKQVDAVKMPRPNKDGTFPEIAYKGPHIFLCMIGGGHFAAMVVSLAPRPVQGGTAMNREATVLAHKTFHRYTTRRKQGGSQGLNDNAKGPAQSVGSSLRRYNEEALRKDIRSLLGDWKGLIDTSELLFVRASGTTNKATLFGPYEGQVLKHNDTRLRTFPFSTRRATQKELMRSFIELTRLKVREIDPVKEEEARQSLANQNKHSSSSTPKPEKQKLTEKEEAALLHTSQLQAFIRRSKLPALLSYLKTNDLDANFELQPPEQNYHAPRPIHLAAAQNSAPLVLGILTRGGADPTITNREGKTAFELAGERATRDAFRVARSELGEDKWPWETAKVPTAMKKQEAERRDEREKQDAQSKEDERRKAEEERLKREEGPPVKNDVVRGKAKTLAAGLAKTPQEKREEEARGLTPEMRTRLERERRARAAEARLRSSV